jgi:hypothetical protein
MKRVLLLLVLLLSGYVAKAADPGCENPLPESNRPNIVYMLTDDLKYLQYNSV